jgi:hypothetical protein
MLNTNRPDESLSRRDKTIFVGGSFAPTVERRSVSMSRSRRTVKGPPNRMPLQMPDTFGQMNAVMQEYSAVRREIDTCLANQVAILSFGTATVGLLVAAAGVLWAEEPLLPGLLLMFVVPSAAFLALVVHAGELVRLMRAGFFLHELENWANNAWSESIKEDGRVLVWEQWSDIRNGPGDVDRTNLIAITVVFNALALGFVFAGYWRLHQPPPEYLIDERLAAGLLVASLVMGLGTMSWVIRLRHFAYGFREAYQRNNQLGTP